MLTARHVFEWKVCKIITIRDEFINSNNTVHLKTLISLCHPKHPMFSFIQLNRLLNLLFLGGIVDINECDIADICGPGGTCTNTDQSYTCACSSGYYGGSVATPCIGNRYNDSRFFLVCSSA